MEKPIKKIGIYVRGYMRQAAQTHDSLNGIKFGENCLTSAYSLFENSRLPAIAGDITAMDRQKVLRHILKQFLFGGRIFLASYFSFPPIHHKFLFCCVIKNYFALYKNTHSDRRTYTS